MGGSEAEEPKVDYGDRAKNKRQSHHVNGLEHWKQEQRVPDRRGNIGIFDGF
jgi:hypothetical protein